MTILDPVQTASATSTTTAQWQRVCALDALHPERGVAALVAGQQIAIFRLHDNSVRAVQQADPYSDDANVMSRGLVGSRAGRPTVASPMYKHVFDLDTGDCVDSKGEAPVALRCWPVRIDDGIVMLCVTGDDEEQSA